MCTVLAIMVLGVPGISSAQDRRLYIGASAMLSTQSSHRQGSAPSLPTGGAGGTAIGVAIEGGGLLTSRIGLGIEISLPSRFTALQETDYLRVFQQESRHRDLALSGVVREIVVSKPRARLSVPSVADTSKRAPATGSPASSTTMPSIVPPGRRTTCTGKRESSCDISPFLVNDLKRFILHGGETSRDNALFNHTPNCHVLPTSRHNLVRDS
jgi:hypothetical protein